MVFWVENREFVESFMAPQDRLCFQKCVSAFFFFFFFFLREREVAKTRVLCPVLMISSVLSTLHSGAQPDSESNMSSRDSVSFERTDKDIERGVNGPYTI